MGTPSEKLAEPLELLHELQNGNGAAAIRAKAMARTHRERLTANGFLRGDEGLVCSNPTRRKGS